MTRRTWRNWRSVCAAFPVTDLSGEHVSSAELLMLLWSWFDWHMAVLVTSVWGGCVFDWVWFWQHIRRRQIFLSCCHLFTATKIWHGVIIFPVGRPWLTVISSRLKAHLFILVHHPLIHGTVVYYSFCEVSYITLCYDISGFSELHTVMQMLKEKQLLHNFLNFCTTFTVLFFSKTCASWVRHQQTADFLCRWRWQGKNIKCFSQSAPFLISLYLLPSSYLCICIPLPQPTPSKV